MLPRVATFFLVLCSCCTSAEVATAENATTKFTIQGRVELPPSIKYGKNWRSECRVLVNYGQHIGFVKKDGSFIVTGVPSGSYIVEVSHVNFVFEPVRVDITSKGKFRARKLNLLQPYTVSTLPYPLRLVTAHQISYFRPREEWRLMDMLTSPMVLMMVVPLVLLVILPKLVNTNDPEVKKEMAKSMPTVPDVDMSEVLTSWLGGSSSKHQKKTKKRQ
ncbi:unnamed protein product [Enterobius vermicularis]|uniref:DUF2012 domain-containing protein n=1 Tax=Enterobius vermicularis TaxID=51028 RepID=A0A0N4VMZ1_ENTVE|nr:unnamed protein product [Enterobius vermicularis]